MPGPTGGALRSTDELAFRPPPRFDDALRRARTASATRSCRPVRTASGMAEWEDDAARRRAIADRCAALRSLLSSLPGLLAFSALPSVLASGLDGAAAGFEPVARNPPAVRPTDEISSASVPLPRGTPSDDAPGCSPSEDEELSRGFDGAGTAPDRDAEVPSSVGAFTKKTARHDGQRMFAPGEGIDLESSLPLVWHFGHSIRTCDIFAKGLSLGVVLPRTEATRQSTRDRSWRSGGSREVPTGTCSAQRLAGG